MVVIEVVKITEFKKEKRTIRNFFVAVIEGLAVIKGAVIEGFYCRNESF